jgi:hypothetical protein
MNRLKLIVLSSALSLITIGVFAGRAKFANNTLWYDDGTGTKVQITNTFTSLTKIVDDGSGSNDVSIVGSASKALYISANGGSTFTRATTNDF